MTKTKHVGEPIFYEALAAAAQCEKVDAVEHMEELETSNHGFAPHAVIDFLEAYAVPA